MSVGLPGNVFVTMAGVAEFAMGVGLLWSPFIRRLSAAATVLVFSAAVVPFGRVDFIGHILLIAIAMVTLADRSPRTLAYTGMDNLYLNVPAMCLLLMVLFGTLYWGLHRITY